MKPEAIEFGAQYATPNFPLLRIPENVVTVIGRRTPRLFTVLYPDGSTLAVDASDLRDFSDERAWGENCDGDV